MTVRKGPRLTYKSNKNPYYIELRNTYSLLEELSANPTQRDQPTSTYRIFKRKAVVRHKENMNKQIDKNIIKAEDNDTEIINAAIKLTDDERSARNKITIHQKDKLGKVYRTATQKHNNR